MVDYCTAAQVASFIGVPTFSGSTDPTDTEVEAFIERNEDEIDNETLHSWRLTTVTEELHTLRWAHGDYRDGTKIFLGHRIIAALSSGSGDKLEVWNGNEDEDYLLTRTEGRNNDWWIDLQTGILHIRTYPRYYNRKYNLKVTYRYGDTAVVKDIEKACVLLTAIDILGSDDRSILFPEGTQNIGLPGKFDKWQAQADRLISKRKEWPIAII